MVLDVSARCAQSTPSPCLKLKPLLSAGRWSLDNDRLAVYIADKLAPLAQDAAGKKMKLGFAKVAIYEAGAELPDHHDQILNEVSNPPSY